MAETMCFDGMVLESAKEILETMMFMDIEEYTDGDIEVSDEQLLGSITFKGEQIEGILAIDCATQNCKNLGLAMLGMEPDDDLPEDEIKDALGEICNMVMGCIKSRLADDYGDVSVSIPSVVSGSSLETSLGNGAEKVVVKGLVDDSFVVEFTLHYRCNS